MNFFIKRIVLEKIFQNQAADRTPNEVAELIKDIIQDKVVCDIGCGDGVFMRALSKYAKHVTGMEIVRPLYDMAKEKGLDATHADSFFEPLPKADVYYSWTRDAMGVYLKAKAEGTKGIFIFGYTIRPSLLKFIGTLKAEEREVKGFKVWITQL